jgi:putative transposase
VQEPVGTNVETAARSTSKVGRVPLRSFIARTREALMELMARRLDDVRLAALMIDGVGLKDHTCVVALGITTPPARCARGWRRR